MRSTILQVQEVRDFIITAILLVIALVLMVSTQKGGLQNMQKLSIVTLSYMEEPLANIRVYRKALKTNEDLRRQNVLLMDELSRLRSVKAQNENLRNMLGFRDTTKLDLLPVMIVGKDLTGINNTLSVDAGSSDSVVIGMPLITPEGLIGQVILTADQYSAVMPYNNLMFRVSAQIQNTRAYGIVSWDGSNNEKLEMNYVPQTIKVDTGMVVETSGYGNQYPPNIPIGKVVGKRIEQGRETQTIYIKPFVSLDKLSEGFIVRFRSDSTLSRLKMQIQNQYQ